nr:MAG TPA: hypothetical protein [Caudoviricetes sp.]
MVTEPSAILFRYGTFLCLRYVWEHLNSAFQTVTI